MLKHQLQFYSEPLHVYKGRRESKKGGGRVGERGDGGGRERGERKRQGERGRGEGGREGKRGERKREEERERREREREREREKLLTIRYMYVYMANMHPIKAHYQHIPVLPNQPSSVSTKLALHAHI